MGIQNADRLERRRRLGLPMPADPLPSPLPGNAEPVDDPVSAPQPAPSGLPMPSEETQAWAPTDRGEAGPPSAAYSAYLTKRIQQLEKERFEFTGKLFPDKEIKPKEPKTKAEAIATYGDYEKKLNELRGFVDEQSFVLGKAVNDIEQEMAALQEISATLNTREFVARRDEIMAKKQAAERVHATYQSNAEDVKKAYETYRFLREQAEALPEVGKPIAEWLTTALTETPVVSELFTALLLPAAGIGTLSALAEDAANLALGNETQGAFERASERVDRTGWTGFKQSVQSLAQVAPEQYSGIARGVGAPDWVAELSGIAAGIALDPFSFPGRPGLAGLPASLAKGGATVSRAVGLEKFAARATRAAEWLEPSRTLKSGVRVPSRAWSDVGFAREQQAVAHAGLRQASRQCGIVMVNADLENIVRHGPVAHEAIPGSGPAVLMEPLEVTADELTAIRRGLGRFGKQAGEELTLSKALLSEGVDPKKIGRIESAYVNTRRVAEGHLRQSAALSPDKYRTVIGKVAKHVNDPKEAERIINATDALIEVAHDRRWAAPYLGATRAERIAAGQTVLPTAVWQKTLVPMMGAVSRAPIAGTLGRWLRTSFVSDYARDPISLAWHAANTAAAADWNYPLRAYAAEATERMAEAMSGRRIRIGNAKWELVDNKTNQVIRTSRSRARLANWAADHGIVAPERMSAVGRVARGMVERHKGWDALADTLKLTPDERIIAARIATELAQDWDYLLNFTQGMGVKIHGFVDDIIDGYYQRVWSPQMRGRILTDPKLANDIRGQMSTFGSGVEGRVQKSGQFGQRAAHGMDAEELEVYLRNEYKLPADFPVFDTNPQSLLRAGFGSAGKAIDRARRLRSGVEQFGKAPIATVRAAAEKAVGEQITVMRTKAYEAVARQAGAAEASAVAGETQRAGTKTVNMTIQDARRVAREKQSFWRNAANEAQAAYRKEASEANRAALRMAREKQKYWDGAASRMGPEAKAGAAKQKLRVEREVGETIRGIERTAGEEAAAAQRQAGKRTVAAEREAADTIIKTQKDVRAEGLKAERAAGREGAKAAAARPKLGKAVGRAEDPAVAAAGKEAVGKLGGIQRKARVDRAGAQQQFKTAEEAILAAADPDAMDPMGRARVVQYTLRKSGHSLPAGESALDVLMAGNAPLPRDWETLTRLALTEVPFEDQKFLLPDATAVPNPGKIKRAWDEYMAWVRGSVLSRTPSLMKDIFGNFGRMITVGTDVSRVPNAARTVQEVSGAKHQLLVTIGVITDVSTADLRLGAHAGAAVPSVFGKVGESIREHGVIGTTIKGVGKVAGALPGAKKLGSLVEKAGEKVGKFNRAVLEKRMFQDNVSRVAHYDTMRAQGMSIQDAAFAVKRDWGDFSEYTKFERKVLRNIFFFYAWKARAFKASGMDWLYRPAMARAMMALAAGNTQNDPDLPQFFRQNGTFHLGIDENNVERAFGVNFAGWQQPLVAFGNLEMMDYIAGRGEWANRERGPLGLIGSAFRDVAKSGLPLVTAAIETTADVDLFSMKRITSTKEDPGAYRNNFAPAAFAYLPKPIRDFIDFDERTDENGEVLGYTMDPEMRVILSGALPGVSATASDFSKFIKPGSDWLTGLASYAGLININTYQRKPLTPLIRRLTTLADMALFEAGKLEDVKVGRQFGSPWAQVDPTSEFGRRLDKVEKDALASGMTREEAKSERRAVIYRERPEVLRALEFVQRVATSLGVLRKIRDGEFQLPKLTELGERGERALAETTPDDEPAVLTRRRKAIGRRAESVAEKEKRIKALEVEAAGRQGALPVPAPQR